MRNVPYINQSLAALRLIDPVAYAAGEDMAFFFVT